MVNALYGYLKLQVLIWVGLVSWIWLVAKLGERKAARDRKK